jgi:hypothetical protein
MNDVQYALMPVHYTSEFYKWYSPIYREKNKGIGISKELKIRFHKREYSNLFLEKYASKIDHQLGMIYLEGVLEGYYLKMLEFSNRCR